MNTGFATSGFATCPEPDISTYNSCTDACPDPVAYTEKYAKCINTCISDWSNIQDDYYSCKETERQEGVEEEQTPPPEDSYPEYHETGYTITMSKGEVELTRNGVIFPPRNRANTKPVTKRTSIRT